MAVDVAPGIWVDEAELVRGHADDFSVLGVQLYEIRHQVPGPDSMVPREAGKC